MKIFKRTFLILIILLSISSAQAQEKKVEFGVAAGYGLNNPRVKDSRTNKDPVINSATLNGFHLGPVIKLNFTEQLGLHTGAMYNRFAGTTLDNSQKQTKKQFGIWRQEKNKYTAIDIPLRFTYSVELADEFWFFLQAGPNFNFSLDRHTISQRFVDRKLSEQNIGANIYDSELFNKFDTQIGAGAGVQWQKLFIRASYDWGVGNRSNITGASLRNNDIKVSLGYIF